jgi:hypothetical protein
MVQYLNFNKTYRTSFIFQNVGRKSNVYCSTGRQPTKWKFFIEKKKIPEAKVLQGINRQIAYIAQSHLPLNFSNKRHQQPPAHLSKLVRNGMNKRQKIFFRHAIVLFWRDMPVALVYPN